MPWDRSVLSPGGYTFLRNCAVIHPSLLLLLFAGLPFNGLHQKEETNYTHFFQPSGGPVGRIHLTSLSSAFLCLPTLEQASLSSECQFKPDSLSLSA